MVWCNEKEQTQRITQTERVEIEKHSGKKFFIGHLFRRWQGKEPEKLGLKETHSKTSFGTKTKHFLKALTEVNIN